jgi:hypothetical protein
MSKRAYSKRMVHTNRCKCACGGMLTLQEFLSQLCPRTDTLVDRFANDFLMDANADLEQKLDPDSGHLHETSFLDEHETEGFTRASST